MPRYKLTIEYDGTPFSGWQRQPDRPSVQQVLEEAIFAMSGEKVGTQTAGRTDAGVHALGQVAHFDLSRDWDPFRVQQALNQHLKPHPVAIVECNAVADTFEARFSALRRHYRYLILNRRARPALNDHRVWHVPVPLDEKLMHTAAQSLLGRHDFTTFRAAACQAESPVRTLEAIAVARQGDMVVLTCSARSFLHHQVRSMMGTIKLVGEGKKPVSYVRQVLEARDRTLCGAMAPSSGLYFVRADYPDQEPDSED